MPMSRLELAEKRLATALENLEKAAEFRGEAQPVAVLDDARIAALENEREQLLERIAALEEELASLSGMTQDLETRLDGAIGEIRAALARS
jgi:predicted  nucleic acid-binding Zn-ribbon protein